MNKKIAVILATSVVVSAVAEANVDTKNMSLEQKQDTAQAIQYLVDTGVLKTDSTQSMTVDSSIIDRLKLDGLLKVEASSAQVICAGGEK